MQQEQDRHLGVKMFILRDAGGIGEGARGYRRVSISEGLGIID